MYVYIVFKVQHYEGETILAIFSHEDLQKAKDYAQEESASLWGGESGIEYSERVGFPGESDRWSWEGKIQSISLRQYKLEE
tara:strand:+ start:339 stop:581 length:243 start_codon:yes stop_codon:yes gene_type:complete